MVNETAAQKARREAEEARKRQDENAERKPPASDTPTPDKPEETQAAKDGDAPPPNEGAQDIGALLARLDAQDRMIATLRAGQAGGTGLAPDEAKDAIAAGPGAQFDPRITRQMAGGVTSGPTMQPHPSSGVEIGRAPPPDQFEWQEGETTVWGRRPDGSVIRPRSYPTVTETDMLVLSTGYYEDAVRNAGDVIHGYTGPLASWLAPLDADGRQIDRQKFIRSLDKAA